MRKVIPLLAFSLVLGLLLVQAGCSEKKDPVEPQPEPCSITMTFPPDGSEFFTGDPVSIRWDKTGTASEVKIELVNGATVATINPAYPNGGYFPWTAQTYGQVTSDQYVLRVTAVGDAACTHQTGAMKITNLEDCEIQFPYSQSDPIGTLTAGMVYPIWWTSANTSGTVRLELWSTSFGPVFTPEEPFWVMAEDVPDTGGYRWTVTSFNASADDYYRWQIYDSHNPDCFQTSYWFRLLDYEVCSMNIIGIGKDMELDPGQEVTLLIESENLTGLVDMDLFFGADRVPGPGIARGFDPTSGPLLWTVTDFGYDNPANNAYRVVVVSIDDPYCIGESERFIITR